MVIAKYGYEMRVYENLPFVISKDPWDLDEYVNCFLI
jgi:hypothetical protein